MLQNYVIIINTGNIYINKEQAQNVALNMVYTTLQNNKKTI